MGIKYDLTPVKILNILGFVEPQSSKADEYLNNFEKEHQLKVPGCLQAFMRLAIDNPLLKTSDIWIENDSLWTFLYDEIELMNEEDDEEYPEFVETPKEEWSTLVPDYLEIGSDYGAGVVTYGINKDDMDKDNPPVYMYNEDDEITEWEKEWDTVSDYLMTVICDALLEFEYDTASCALKNESWECQYYENSEHIEGILKQHNIDVSLIHKVKSNYAEDPDNEYLGCFYDEKHNMLFVISKGAHDTKIYTYCK